MQTLTPSRALVRQAYRLLQVGFVIVAVGIFLIMLSLLAFVIPPFPRGHSLYAWFDLLRNGVFLAGVLVGLAGLGVAIRAVTQRRENNLAQMTGDFLQSQFDNHFVFIHNINRIGGLRHYIDAVLIGPPGALVFRILDAEGEYANEGSGWLKKTSGQWRIPMRLNPTREVVDDVQHLRKFLSTRQLDDVQVFGVIVFTRNPDEVQIAEKNPVVPIAHLASLKDDLKDSYLSKMDRIPPTRVAALRKLLLAE